MNNKIEDISLDELLPQNPPFVMIDKLVSSDDVASVSEFEIREDNIFFHDGCLTAAGMVENIAQTCAAGIGYQKRGRGESVKIGVIGAVSNMNILRLPQKGERIITTVEYVEEVFQMTLFKATIKSGDEELANASIKTALTDVDAQ